MAYIVLFFSAFISATLLPLGSELTFITLLQGTSNTIALWAVATIGNTLGATVNWVLGRYLIQMQNQQWFPFKKQSLGRAQMWFERYGKWSLLLSWLPIVGDALTFLAGAMRVGFTSFLVLTAIGKGMRYAFVVIVVLKLFPTN